MDIAKDDSERINDGTASSRRFDIDVCIFVDPICDFLLESGMFCKTYGLEIPAK